MMKKAKNNSLVYSTNPDFEIESDRDSEYEEVPPNQQMLRIFPDRKNRKGKTVTLVTGFKGTDSELKDLEKSLKAFCGTGGSVKDGEIIIQGNLVQKVNAFLEEKGYKTKVSGI